MPAIIDYILVTLIDTFLDFEKKEALFCVACHSVVTIKHTFLERADLNEIRKSVFKKTPYNHCFELSARKEFLTSLKKLVCSVKYEVCGGDLCVTCFDREFL